jgi:hypothetical protein
MVVAPNMNVVRGGILIRCATKLGSGSGGVLVGIKESESKFNTTNSNY